MFKSGDILVVKNDPSWLGRLVRFFTKSPYVHVAVIINADGVVIESVSTGVITSNITKFTNIEMYRVLDATPAQIQLTIDFLKEEIGDPYDFGGVLYLAWLILTFNTKARNEWDDKNKWTCSELTATAFATAGIIFAEDVPLSNVTPKDIVTSDIVVEIE